MTEERCERTDLITTQCAHCLGHANPIAEAEDHEHRRYANSAPRTISASYPGSCPDCGEDIQVGDPITVVGDGGVQGRWVCSGCAP